MQVYIRPDTWPGQSSFVALLSAVMGQYQTRTKSVDEEQAQGTLERRPSDEVPVFGSPIDSRCCLICGRTIVVERIILCSEDIVLWYQIKLLLWCR